MAKTIFEVRNSYYDEESNYYTIDAWFNEEEEGKVIAVVNGTTSDVWFIDNQYRTDPMVIDAINELKSRIEKNDDEDDEEDKGELHEYYGEYGYDEAELATYGLEIVTWAESQYLLELPKYRDHCQLINDIEGLEKYGSSAYVVETAWLNEMRETKSYPF